jgi:uncharacterized membrane protein
MAHMSIQYTITIERSAEHIFKIYKDVESWAKWDPDIDSVALDGEFSAGTTGWIKPVGAPKTKTILTQVNEPLLFTVESRLPLCTMHFEHELLTEGNKTHVTHRVAFSGPLSVVFSKVIGGKIKKGIEATMQGLKHYAEA